MKNKGKLISLLMTLTLLFAAAISGCGGGSATTPTAPPAPTGVTATPGNGQASIAWTVAPGVTSYNIYWSTSAGVTPANAANRKTGATTPFTQSGLTNGTTYYFVVTAVNSGGESAPSALVSGTPALPVPSGVIATPGNGQTTIAWTTVAGATSYNIYWSATAGVTPANGTKIAGAANPYPLTGLTNGTTYYFVVTAVFGASESAASIQVSAIPAGTPTPSAPAGVTATPGNGQATIAWTAASGATSYNIYWATTSGVSPVNATNKIAGAANPYILTGLTNGTTYYFVVTAVNGNGESTPSSEANATPSAASSTAPFIQATVLGLVGLGNPLSWLLNVAVYTDSSLTTPITNATVIVNGFTLTYDASRGTYDNPLPLTVPLPAIPPGATVTVSVTIGSSVYTATGTQFTTFPVLTVPNLPSEPILFAANANTFAWSAGAPAAGASYLFGLVDEITNIIVFPKGNLGLLNVGGTSFVLPANSVAPGSAAYVFLGIATAGIAPGIGHNTGGIPIANTAPGSGLWLGQLTASSPIDFN